MEEMKRNKLTLTLVREKDDGTTEELVKQDLSHVMILGECYDEPSKMCECICQTSVNELAQEIAQTHEIIKAAKRAIIMEKLIPLMTGMTGENSTDTDPEDKLAEQINGGSENGGEDEGI